MLSDSDARVGDGGSDMASSHFLRRLKLYFSSPLAGIEAFIVVLFVALDLYARKSEEASLGSLLKPQLYFRRAASLSLLVCLWNFL